MFNYRTGSNTSKRSERKEGASKREGMSKVSIKVQDIFELKCLYETYHYIININQSFNFF